MSLKSRTYWLCPRSWFPAHNPIARSVARLCVLREDLYIEWLGLAAGEITITLPDTAELPFPSLDDNGDAYRRIYFLRASLRTLTEVYSAASSLRNNKNFRKLYRNFNQTKYNQFNEYLRALDKNLKELKRLRNALGGHVSKEGIQKALETMDFSEIGTLEVGKLVKDTHYRFAGTIVGTILLQDVPEKRRHQYLLGIVDLNFQTEEIISDILTAYLVHEKRIE